MDVDCALVSIGRRPVTAGLGLEEIGVKMAQNGMIETDGHLRTSVPGVYAIGDCIDGPMLAHKVGRCAARAPHPLPARAVPASDAAGPRLRRREWPWPRCSQARLATSTTTASPA